MAFNRTTPSFDSAASGNADLRRALESMHGDIQALKQKTGSVAIDTDKKSPIALKPPQTIMEVQGIASAGRFVVNITNPEFVGPGSGAKGNVPRTAVIHEVSYTQDPAFIVGIITLQPSPQTYFPIFVGPNTDWYVRARSSYDGINWGPYARSGKVSA